MRSLTQTVVRGDASDEASERANIAARDPLGPDAAAASRGDKVALRAVLTGVSPLVLRTVRSLLGANHPDVDDLVQDVLIGVAQALPSFRGECKVAHFAARIAVRRSTDARRLNRKRAVRMERIAEWEPQATATSPDAETLAERRRQLLRSVLDSLPAVQAETMAFRFMLGYSLEEVAEATGVPVNTVRSRVRLAREAMRKRIEQDPALAELWEAAS